MNFHLERFLQFGTLSLLLFASLGQSVAAPPLQVFLEPKPSESVLGAPLKLTASIRNVSSAAVLTYTLDQSSPLTDDIDFSISEDGSLFHAFRGPQWYAGGTIDIGRGMTRIKPGEKVQASFSLLWNGPLYREGRAPTGDFAFPHAGTYFVKARVSSKFGDLISNVVRVVIKDPQGDDAAIWEVLKADKGLAQYYAYPDGATGPAEKLQQLLNKYPNSSHAVSMKKALAEYSKQKAEAEQAKKANANSQQQC